MAASLTTLQELEATLCKFLASIYILHIRPLKSWFMYHDTCDESLSEISGVAVICSFYRNVTKVGGRHGPPYPTAPTTIAIYTIMKNNLQT